MIGRTTRVLCFLCATLIAEIRGLIGRKHTTTMKIEVPFLEIGKILSKAIKLKNGSESQNCFAKFKQWAAEKAVDNVSISGISSDEIQIGIGMISTTLKIAKIEHNDITITTSNAIDTLLKLVGNNLDGIIRRDGDNSITIPFSAIPQTKEAFEWIKIDDICCSCESLNIEASPNE